MSVQYGERKTPSDANVFPFSQTVHSRSSPADTCTPPNQKSRVKKKVSKSSAYRRDIQGGEWGLSLDSDRVV